MALTAGLDPDQLAEVVATERDTAYVDALRLALARQQPALQRLRQVWELSTVELAAMFGVSRQAVARWLERGVPRDRRPAVADMMAATDLLVRHLRGDRIPAVVRRPMPAYGGRSLVELAASDRREQVLPAVRAMFAFERAVG
ncbi:MAG TPA: hypothetical protein VFD41_11050 [Actinomycetales bacterium]|nr:hypothetical protein [Actinomycetales bacterium]